MKIEYPENSETSVVYTASDLNFANTPIHSFAHTLVHSVTHTQAEDVEDVNEEKDEMVVAAEEECAPLISVIVPIYNVEKYVSKCLESLKNQTMKQIEVICIDDGSTDGSGLIADEYCNTDED